MEYRYYKQIFDLLFPLKRKGLKLQAIVLYLYNENNTLFESAEDYQRIYRSVQAYLLRQSKCRNGHFARVTHKRGWFRVRVHLGQKGSAHKI